MTLATAPAAIGLTASSLSGGLTAAPRPEAAGAASFSQTLQSALGSVNQLQNHAADMTRAYAAGKTGDVHDVMIAVEQAGVALQMTTQVRNKVVDAYQEIMRISM